MAFIQEPTHYHKTVISDLQGPWSLLRETVANSLNVDKLFFHIDEAMSWESVRNLALYSTRSNFRFSAELFCPIAALRKQLHRLLCACLRALLSNKIASP